ncbi:MAG: DUF87 domain-containing protein [Cyclobacteriaceae bacterium]|nr:ATP-binding protein [Cyclobacteriaceae bacterium]MCH8517839.1 DUF87 domain-containing protein [Cyclobacteriaceae bacterium]
MNKISKYQQNEIDNLQQDLFRGYISQGNFTIKKQEFKPLDYAKNVRFIRLEKFVYEKNAKVHLKLRSIYSALHSIRVKLIFKVISDGDSCEILLGVKSYSNVSDAIKVLRGSLEGNFPGSTIAGKTELKNSEVEELNRYSVESAKEITAVLGVPSAKKEDDDEFIQGIENLIFGMQGKPFTAMFIADPVRDEEVSFAVDTYEKVYSVLSHLQEHVENQAENISYAESLGESSSTTESRASGKTKSNSVSEGKSESKTINSSPWLGKKIANAIGGTNSHFYSIADSYAEKGNKVLNKVNKALNFSESSKNIYFKSKAEGSKTTGTNSSNTISSSTSDTLTEGRTEGSSRNETNTSGTSFSTQRTHINKRVVNFLEKIDNQIKRLESGKGQGFWNVGAYFLSDRYQNSVMAANIYAGVVKGEQSQIEPYLIETFSSIEKGLEEIKESLSNYELPKIINGDNDDTFLANAINTNELTIQISLPNKSVPGLDVVEVASFGSNLKTVNSIKKIDVGRLFNYDREYTNPIYLDSNKFTSHVFITGSTGSGKSNVTYNLLENLYNKGVKFLVVEPAKGEYKDVFGNKKDVNVFGTNPKLNHLLKLNPFSFPANIHIYEHIDRFIEILNACWPMESAMPAIIKEAIEKAYINKGWDLIQSVNPVKSRDFPDFHDLLYVLPEVIKQTGYSEEIKSNYQGALVTRVKSLTNGILSLIFSKDEISDEQLFDQNVIADLSRVASSETKALLMGVLFMKLNEYRISNIDQNNNDLKHVTVLEEAHNLLKKTSSDQSSNSANIQGKSVEMISNSIAEMRSYGEGFILADQAPGLMDMSAIRNTNTKICLRLPDFDDRELVGKAMNLSDEQIKELASLNTGVAAVYQNDWQEAVLCKFHLFENKEKNYVSPVLKDERALQLTLARYWFDHEFRQEFNLSDLVMEYELEPYFKYYGQVIEKLQNNKEINDFSLKVLKVAEVINFTIYNSSSLNQKVFSRNYKKNLYSFLKMYYSKDTVLKIYKLTKSIIKNGN